MYDLFLFSGGLFAAALALGQLVNGSWNARRLVRLAFFGCFAVLLFLRWRDSDGRYDGAPVYLRLYIPFAYWAVAALYLYMRDLAAARTESLRRRDLLHFVPGLLAVLALLPFYLSDPVSKVRAYAQSGLPIWARDAGLPDFVEFACILAVAVYGIGAFIVALRAPADSTSPGRSRSLQLIAAIGLTIVAGSQFGIVAHPIGYHFAVILFPLLLLAFFLADQRDPGFLRDPEWQLRSKTGGGDSQISRLGGLDEAAVLQRARELMHGERLYCDEDLSVAGLAEHLGIRADQLSAILNRVQGQNFNAFVNEYRVAAVQAMLLESPDRTILSVALACGFNSQRAFQAAFRKHTGLSAREYRQQHAPRERVQV